MIVKQKNYKRPSIHYYLALQGKVPLSQLPLSGATPALIGSYEPMRAGVAPTGNVNDMRRRENAKGLERAWAKGSGG